MELQKGLREFIELLNSEGVRYVIVGGYAVAFHGHPRFTGDIDVFIDTSAPNSRKMEQVVRKFGFSESDLTAGDFVKPGAIIQLGVAPNRVDMITSIDAVEFDEAWDTRVEAAIDNVPVNFISKDLLPRNKAARPPVERETLRISNGFSGNAIPDRRNRMWSLASPGMLSLMPHRSPNLYFYLNDERYHLGRCARDTADV